MEGVSKQLRVLIADDDESTRLLLTESLADEPTVELVGAAKDADEAIAMAAELEPEVVILDWVMPGGGGARAAVGIKEKLPEVAVIALTGMDTAEASYEMMSAGAVAFLSKDAAADELIEAIRGATRW